MSPRLSLLLLVGLLTRGQAMAQLDDRGLHGIEGSYGARNGAPSRLDGERFVALVSADYDVRVTGSIARTRVRHVFRNESGRVLRHAYLFRLPRDAAVARVLLRVGERTITSAVLERQAADNEPAVEGLELATPRLADREGGRVLALQVAHIEPGEKLSAEIEYQHGVAFDRGEFNLRIPLAAAYPGSEAGLSAFRVAVDAGVPLVELQSQSHRIRRRPTAGRRIEVELNDDGIPARDFVLSWRVAAHERPRAVLFSEVHDDQHYALLMLLPPESGNAVPLPRDVVLVIDTSGSMEGKAILQARDALLIALSRLSTRDRFNIIRFATSTELLFPEPAPATIDNLSVATRYIHELESSGGTEMYQAIRVALRQFAGAEHHDRVEQVVFITDGKVANERVLCDLVAREVGHVRLFTVGIGPAPSDQFLQRIARRGRARFVRIDDVNDVGTALSSLLYGIEQPMLTDISIDGSADARIESIPKSGDLYRAEPLVLHVKGDLPRNLIVSGRIADAPWSQSVSPEIVSGQAGIAEEWARASIEQLLEWPHVAKPGDPRYDAVVATAIAHEQISRYTRMAAIDARSGLESAEIGLVMAEYGDLSMGSGSRQSPRLASSGWPLLSVLGALLALPLLGWLLSWRRRRN